MSKVQVEQGAAYGLLNPGSVVLVSVGDGDNDNLFSVTWNMPVRKDPGMLAILSGKRHYSYGFMASTGEFGVNIPSASMVDQALGCGRVTGHDGVDKFDRFGLTRMKAEKIKAPMVEEAVANLECRVCHVADLGSSSLLLAQILFARVDKDHYRDGKLHFENGLELLHHMGGDRFCVSDRSVIGARDSFHTK